MSRRGQLEGQKFGRWTVQSYAGDGRWLCLCSCKAATKRAVFGPDLKKVKSVSCGCFRSEATTAAKTTHGRSGGKDRTYIAWKAMHQRCRPDNDAKRQFYADRGISVCERWFSFENFLADMGDKPPGLTLERLNNDGNYEPTNCAWKSMKAQGNNRRPRSSFPPRDAEGRFAA